MLVSYYAWWPIVYLAIYLPFVVPRLGLWNRIPVSILVGTMGAFVLLGVCAGALLNQRWILVHAFGVAAFLQVCEAIAARYDAPGLANGWSVESPAVFWVVLFPVKILGLIVVFETGRLGVILYERLVAGRGDSA